MWVAVLWLCLADHVPRRGVATGAMRTIYSTLSFLGTSATVAVLSFVAYLIGLFAVVDPRESGLLLQLGKIRRYWNSSPGTASQYISGPARKALDEYLRRRVRIDTLHAAGETVIVAYLENLAPNLPSDERRTIWADMLVESELEEALDWSIDILNRIVVDELPYLINRLQVDQEKLFDRQDRLFAEGEFRLNTSFPLLALSISCAILLSPWFLATSPVALASSVQGIRKLRTANDAVINAIVSELLAVPYITNAAKASDDAFIA